MPLELPPLFCPVIYDNFANVKTALANLLGVNRDYVKVLVPSLTSSAEPFDNSLL